MDKKKNTDLLLIFLMTIVAAFSLSACQNRKINITYTASEGGSIIGQSSQTVEYGGSSSSATAVADEGFAFIRWSDGNLNATRTDENITTTLSVTAEFERIENSVIYIAGTGGSLTGQSSQTVEYGGSSSSVTAVADEGFAFIRWSDGNLNATRTDENITTTLSVTAEFERIKKTFNYVYNNATVNNTQTNIILYRSNLQDADFIIPQREYFNFNGWYLESDFKTQVTDALGSLLVGEEIFDNNSSKLYAKWTAVQEITYKILMVYVDEINAMLETADGSYMEVKYKMSALERKLCEVITLQVSSYLNKMLDGLIKFELDSYFTKTALTKEDINQSKGVYPDGSQYIEYMITAKNIAEVSGMLDDYKCTMTTFSFNDYKGILHNAGGYGSEGDVKIHFENLVRQTFANGDTIEDLFDLKYKEWDNMMTTYIHEFAHSIEQGMSVYPLHSALTHYEVQGIWGLEPLRLYLLNQSMANGKKVGIPYPYWTEEVFTVNYIAEKNYYGGEVGYIEGGVMPNGRPQRVAKGYDAFSVTVHTFPGYVFVGWSDGITSPTRTDTNIQSDVSLIAYFKPIEQNEFVR